MRPGIILPGGTEARLQPVTIGVLQAAAADLRQAGELLPVVHTDSATLERLAGGPRKSGFGNYLLDLLAQRS
jgi:hypothetical protein